MFFSMITVIFLFCISKNIVLADINESSGNFRDIRYDEYLSKYKDKEKPEVKVIIPSDTYINASKDVKVVDNFNNYTSKVIYTSESSFVEWEINIDREGLYNISLDYFPIEGKTAAIEREFYIDGKLPFDEARSIMFYRVWKDACAIIQDGHGNDLTPKQVENPIWQNSVFKDSVGFYNENFSFYFSKGKHTIKLNSVKEPMVIGNINLFQQKVAKSYAEVSSEYANKGYKETKGYISKVQAETPKYKSSPVLLPIYDKSSPLTEPYDAAKLKLNSFGGVRWKTPGDWAEWEIEVPQDGLYQIAFKSRQNSVRGRFSSRRLEIDGKIPFKEVQDLRFEYDDNWGMKLLGGDKPYLFYLTKGKHSIRMQAELGELSTFLRTAEESVYKLNEAYRNIMMITGTSPDLYRDYRIDEKVPAAIETFKKESANLKKLKEDFEKVTGQKSTYTATIDTLTFQLDDMIQNPDNIPKLLQNFRSNISSLGTWIVQIKEQPLELDYIVVSSTDKALPKAKANIFQKAVHEMKSVVASFTEDYNAIGSTADTNKRITVWISQGRDQANILKNMIDSDFTPKTGIAVNLRLVEGALLQSVVGGRAPDVALSIGANTPVDYATRNAVVDLTQFKDYQKIEDLFGKEIITPMKYQNGVYGLPERLSFPLMFYRKDIMAQLGIKIPQTWDEVHEILPILQRNNLQMGIQAINNVQGGSAAGISSTYVTQLYQNNGTLYKNNGAVSNLDSEEAILSFKKWTELYTNYKLPITFDFANRFRSGEMPIGIVDYTAYNQLTVFAPEIRGLWGFAPVPGTVSKDGTINKSVPGTGTCSIMLKTAKDKDSAWEFMKWWAASETQLEFGRGLESIMGEAARYNTANREALSKLPWPAEDYKSLSAQLTWVKGIPEVPGGYLMGRHVDNAFRKVTNNGDNARESLLDYVKVINKEIELKRKEFGLDNK